MNEIIKNRREIVYLYDASYCNPNGDPADENKPRTDPETNFNLVSDVRLKRTIRDFLHEIKNHEIFVQAKADEKGDLPDAKTRAQDYKGKGEKGEKPHEAHKRLNDNILRKCIDVRLFGATIPLGKGKTTITHTGPVQFKIGKSLHRVNVEKIKGTGAFASSAEKDKTKKQRTFRTEYIVPYSLIGFYGIVNEHRADDTNLSESDLRELFEGMWTGTKHLVSRSKIGQTPRFLLSVKYKPGNFQISDLDHKFQMKSGELTETMVRSTDDYVLNIEALLSALTQVSDKIDSIELMADDHICLTTDNGQAQGLEEISKLFENVGFKVIRLNLD